VKKISDKQILKLQKAVEVKKVIIRRCGGIPFESAWSKGVCINVRCIGGFCEYCGFSACTPSWDLHNHEEVFKSAGGKVSEWNSFMACDCCHDILQHHADDKLAVRWVMKYRKCTQDIAELLVDKLRYSVNAHDIIRSNHGSK